ncbi:MAG: CpXC domain-containing protein [Eubacterium sp.]|nr:CpXC domain-containing protein [Eubacterium sp.]
MNEKKLTRWTIEEMACPKCGQRKKIKKYQVINVSEKPRMKEDILKNNVFFFRCDNCNLAAPLTYPCVYIDRKKKLAILMTPEIEDESKKLLHSLGDLSGYKKRLTDNINDLKEKIMIYDNHMDDRAIELMKIEYIRQLKKEMEDDELMNILFDYSGHDMYFMLFFEKKGIGRVPINQEFYRQSEIRFINFLKPGFNEDFEKIDLEWAGNIVFKRN